MDTKAHPRASFFSRAITAKWPHLSLEQKSIITMYNYEDIIRSITRVCIHLWYHVSCLLEGVCTLQTILRTFLWSSFQYSYTGASTASGLSFDQILDILQFLDTCHATREQLLICMLMNQRNNVKYLKCTIIGVSPSYKLQFIIPMLKRYNSD